MKIILASASPRRKELLTLAGFDYEVVVSECEEILSDGITPDKAVEELARQKAEDVFARHNDAMIIAADTVVALDNTILGNRRMKTMLSECFYHFQAEDILFLRVSASKRKIKQTFSTLRQKWNFTNFPKRK